VRKRSEASWEKKKDNKEEKKKNQTRKTKCGTTLEKGEGRTHLAQKWDSTSPHGIPRKKGEERFEAPRCFLKEPHSIRGRRKGHFCLVSRDKGEGVESLFKQKTKTKGTCSNCEKAELTTGRGMTSLLHYEKKKKETTDLCQGKLHWQRGTRVSHTVF